MTVSTVTPANRFVIVLLPICRQHLFRNSPLLRNMNPEMRTRKFLRVDQLNRAIVCLDTLQYYRQADARAGSHGS